MDELAAGQMDGDPNKVHADSGTASGFDVSEIDWSDWTDEELLMAAVAVMRKSLEDPEEDKAWAHL